MNSYSSSPRSRRERRVLLRLPLGDEITASIWPGEAPVAP